MIIAATWRKEEVEVSGGWGWAETSQFYSRLICLARLAASIWTIFSSLFFILISASLWAISENKQRRADLQQSIISA